ncbi:MAG: redoxin domain-containing protein, partial [Planctomycetes bacterium]|nr:redoxin domain-containing protein [Planctomycetota bacterium]
MHNLTRLVARGSPLAAFLLCLHLPSCSTNEGRAAGLEAPNPKSEIRNPKSKNPLAFQGETLDGWTFDLAARNAHRRLLVYIFDPTAAPSQLGTKIAQRLHAERLAHNIEVIAVAIPPGYTPLAAQRIPRERPKAPELAKLARAHLDKLGADFPCVLDPDAAIVERYTLGWGTTRLDQLPAFYPFELAASDADRPIFPRYAGQAPDPAEYLARRILQRFGVEATVDVDPALGDHPPAPPFAVTDTAGKKRALADYRGRALVLVLWARDCPRCDTLLTFLARVYPELGPTARRGSPPKPGDAASLDVLAVCTDTTGDALKALAAQRAYPFPVAADPDWALRAAFRYRGTVPDTFVVGPDGRIRFRLRDFSFQTLALLEMQAHVLLGLPITPLLERGAFSGDQACRVCHQKQHADWTLTPHACAWESLVRIGKENDPKCVRCHVVGHAQGGFVSLLKTPHLAGVQCEACHGQNGCRAFTESLPPAVIKPDASPAPAKAKLQPSACLFCHDTTHSPRFDFDSYRKRVLHNQRAELLKLPRTEREARLRRLCAGADGPLFDAEVPYVGSAACAKCHPTEAAALKDGFHAKALGRLTGPAPTTWDVPRHKRGVVGINRPDCLRCHTTGYGRPGGYPAPPGGTGLRPVSPTGGTPVPPTPVPPTPAPPPVQPGGTGLRPVSSPMGGVGCEACHGPGKAHCDDPKKPRAILKLGAGCPECVVLPVCRACHDDDNDPAFDYRSALPKARHP